MITHHTGCALADAEDTTRASDAQWSPLQIRRPATATERALLASNGYTTRDGQPIDTITDLCTLVTPITDTGSVSRRTWPDLTGPGQPATNWPARVIDARTFHTP